MITSYEYMYGVVFVLCWGSIFGSQDNSTTTTTITTTSNHTATTPAYELAEESLTGDSDSVKDVVVVNGRAATVPGQLVKCRCGGREVLVKNECQFYPNETFIYAEDDAFQTEKVPVSSLDVVIYDPDCQTQDGHRELRFDGTQFYLRQRGDIVLMGEVGDLAGLRINNYCVSHYMDEEGRVSWSMKKACIPPPSVPRCCPPGEAMDENGICQQAASPSHLLPPISADLFKDAVPWPVVKNHINTITCTKDPVKSLPLIREESYLLTVPTGMVHLWNPDIEYLSKKYTYPDDFCVDGVERYQGEVIYSVKLCYSDPLETHQKACDGNICVRKCCQDGDILDSSLYRCVPNPDTNSTYEPPFSARPPSLYKTLFGYPLCTGRAVVMNATIDDQGHMKVGNELLPPTHYCTDILIDGQGRVESGALVCLSSLTTWEEIRSVVIPVCQCASMLFLALTLACYCCLLLPGQLKGAGVQMGEYWCHVFHASSLMFAFATSFAQYYGASWDDPTCVAVAVIMQFWFLCTFCWLTVLCFHAWRRIRSLNRKQPSPETPLGRYMMFAYGGPLVISLVTALMHYFAPDQAEGIIKPNLAVSRCWFPDTIELLAYFYGPSACLFAINVILNAVTYVHYRSLQRSGPGLRQLEDQQHEAQALDNDLDQQSRDAVADFKQQFSLLVLMSICWAFEILSWKIPPPEMWAPTDIINSLQGFFIFIFFVANSTKRTHLKQKFPRVFVFSKKLVSSFFCRKGEKEEENMSASPSVSNILRASSPPSPSVNTASC